MNEITDNNMKSLQLNNRDRKAIAHICESLVGAKYLLREKMTTTQMDCLAHSLNHAEDILKRLSPRAAT